MIIYPNETNIAQTEYVEQTTIIANTDTAGTKSLCTRIFTTNELMPTDSFSFAYNAEQVGETFGTDSEEYKRAVFYFSFPASNLMNNYRVPDLLSFAKYTPNAVKAKIFGAKVTASVSTFQSISSGQFSIVLNGNETNFTLDFTSVTSYSDVATILKNAFNAITIDPQLVTADCVFDSSRGSFNFESSTAGECTISVLAPFSGLNLLPYIGWTSSAIFSNGSDGESVTDTLSNSFNANQDFASFLFMPGLQLSETVEAANWVSNVVKPNFSCAYLTPVALENAQDWYDAIVGNSGVMMTVSNYDTETPQYEEMIPGSIVAAIDYTANNQPNYKYQICDLIPSVVNTSMANFLNNLGINYVGRTKKNTPTQAGLIFYQNGVLVAPPEDVNNLTNQMSVYFNEVWFKAALAQYFLNLLTSRGVPADTEGQTIILSVASQVVQLALNNGTIINGKTLSNSEKAFVTQLTGDPDAYQSVQIEGFYQWVQLEGAKAKYNIVYTSRGLIQMITGYDVII